MRSCNAWYARAYGLTKDELRYILDPADIADWHQVADQANTVVRGKVVPAAIFDEVVKLRDEYRAQHKR